MNENVIEWISGDETVSVTFSQRKYVNRIKKLSENAENNVVILRENPDGSIFAHLPISAVKLTPKRTQNLSVEQKNELSARLALARQSQNR